jgi:WD40 repeat protein
MTLVRRVERRAGSSQRAAGAAAAAPPEGVTADVFISYSRRDAEFVHRLDAALSDCGKEVWVDWEDIPPTAEWLERVFEGIERSDNFLFVITPQSLTSEICARELAHAVALQKRLVPVLVRDPGGTPVPAPLASREWMFFRPSDDFAAAVETLVKALDTDLEWVSAHTRLLGRALEWQKRGRDTSVLLRGRDLDEAERWVASQSAEREPRPTPLQLEYVLASRHATTRRQRLVVGAALVAVLVTSGLAVLAWSQRNEAIAQQTRAEREARLAHSRQLAAESVAAADADPEQSVVLAAHAASVAGTDAARDALRRALRSSQLRAVVDTGATIFNAAVSPTGHVVAAALTDGSVRTWSLPSGNPLARLRSPTAPIQAVAISADGRRVVGVSSGGAFLWSASGAVGAPLAKFDRTNRPLSAAFSPDGATVATGDFGGVVRLWRAADGAPHGRLLPRGAPAPITAVAFSSDGSRLAAAVGRNVDMWDLRAQGAPAVYTDDDDVSAVGFSPDGVRVATGDVDGTVRVWNRKTGGATQLIGHVGMIRSVAFGPDGASLVTASEDETARIWDAASGKLLAELRGHDGLVLGAAFASGGDTVVTGGSDGTLRTWATTPDPVVDEFVAPARQSLRDASFDPSGTLVVTASDDLTARVWELADGRVLHVLRQGRTERDWVETSRFSRDGRLVLTAGDDGTARLWDASSGAPLATVGSPGGPSLYDAALSPDGRLVAAGGAGPVVRLWSWRQGALVRRLATSAERVDGVAFSPSGRLLAATAGEAVRIWRVSDGSLVAVLPSRERQWRLTSVAFAPSGRFVAAGSTSGAAMIWDLADRRRVARATGHKDTATDVSFSADGLYLATAGHDGIANVWSVPGGRRVTTVRSGSSSLEAVGFAPEGHRLVVAGSGGRVTVFDCAECRPLPELVCLAATRVTSAVRARSPNAFLGCD